MEDKIQDLEKELRKLKRKNKILTVYSVISLIILFYLNHF